MSKIIIPPQELMAHFRREMRQQSRVQFHCKTMARRTLPTTKKTNSLPRLLIQTTLTVNLKKRKTHLNMINQKASHLMNMKTPPLKVKNSKRTAKKLPQKMTNSKRMLVLRREKKLKRKIEQQAS